MQSLSTAYCGLLVVFISTPVPAQFYSGSELHQDVQLLSLVGTGNATSEDYAKIGRLLGYIDGFVDAHQFVQPRGARAPKDSYTFCLPQNYVGKDLHDSVES